MGSPDAHEPRTEPGPAGGADAPRLTPRLTRADVQRAASLARLRLSDADAEQLRDELARILEHADRLGALDLDDLEPLAHIGDTGDGEPRWDPDEPGPTLGPDEWRSNAPDVAGPFFRVPRVLDTGGGSDGDGA